MAEMQTVKADIVCVRPEYVKRTLAFLRSAGARDSEGVVLWLGSRRKELIEVYEAYVPLQEAGHSYFRIPRKGMADLLARLGETRWLVAAQVHSHPEEAFHSGADNRLAIVRHHGALSIVVPSFAGVTAVEDFVGQVEVFCLGPNNDWQPLRPSQRERCIRIE